MEKTYHVFIGLLVPKTLHVNVLKILHRAHTRKERILIINIIADSCESCCTLPKDNYKKPLPKHDVPNQAWIKLYSDLFEFNKKHYLVVVDYFLKVFQILLT